jgi:tetratricopeptide (TPR) repeat protein
MKQLSTIALVTALAALSACGHSQPAQPRSADPLAAAPVSLLLKRGRAFAAAGDTIRAEQYLVAASNRGARYRDVVPLLLQTCIRGQRFRAALAHAEHYLARRPQDEKLRQMTGVLYLATGAPDRAREALEAVIEDSPDEAEPHYLLAMAHQQMGEHRLAARELRAFLDIEPNGAMARSARSWLDASDTSGASDDDDDQDAREEQPRRRHHHHHRRAPSGAPQARSSGQRRGEVAGRR